MDLKKFFNFNKIINKFKHLNFKTLDSSIKRYVSEEKININRQHKIVFLSKEIFFISLKKGS